MKWQDILIGTSFVFNIGAKTITQILLTNIGSITSTANSLESNPIARSLQGLGYAYFILTGIQYAAIITLYLWLRKKSKVNEGFEIGLNLTTLSIFLLNLLDLLNDLAILVGAGKV